jgi:hypothetical protein
MRCAKCDKAITSTRESAYEIKGWEKARAAGGTNHVLFRERTGRVMCSTCLIAKTYGVSDDQLTLT